MTDDEAKARIELLQDEAAAILAEQGLSPLRAYCLILEQVGRRDRPLCDCSPTRRHMTNGFGNRYERGWRKPTNGMRWISTMKRKKAMPESEPNCSLGSEKAMPDDYTRCGTLLAYAGQLRAGARYYQPNSASSSRIRALHDLPDPH